MAGNGMIDDLLIRLGVLYRVLATAHRSLAVEVSLDRPASIVGHIGVGVLSATLFRRYGPDRIYAYRNRSPLHRQERTIPLKQRHVKRLSQSGPLTHSPGYHSSMGMA
jgi:hypothetical protein